jgi:hypothetical protein
MDKAPAWAFEWCYFFLGSAIATLIVGVAGLTMYKKLTTEMIAIFIIGTLAQAATGMTLFWMCRASLRPQGN